jgi:hexokinase
MTHSTALFDDNSQRILDDIDRQFHPTVPTLVDLTKKFLLEFKLGLDGYGQPMAMIPTFVTGVPDGTERGTFLALDLGGTNLRVCEVILNGDKTFHLRQQKYKVSESLKTGDAVALFDYLADSVDEFLTKEASIDYEFIAHSGDEHAVLLGLTFSFPVEQTALDSGKILTWTKGFSAKNAIGNDVVKLLQDAFDRKHMHVKCVALVNDTVGALLSRAYVAGGCLLGAIFGTGTNGAYIEEVAKIRKLKGASATEKGGHMVVNTEWGAFNNSRSHLPSTPFDKALDRLSINPSYQAFEKFVSGMYLGEIVRNILTALIDAAPRPLLFDGKSTPAVNKHYGVDTSLMSSVEEAWQGGGESGPVPQFFTFDPSKLEYSVRARLEKVRGVIVDQLGFRDEDVSLRDAEIVRWACYLVARRAALFSGVAVAAVLIQTGRAVLQGEPGAPTVYEERMIVGIDGSLAQHYPNFEKMARESLRALVGEQIEKRLDIGLAKDGSGVGAALCALQAIKQGPLSPST